MGSVLRLNVHKGNDLVLDDIHSFILRISLNRAHGGKGEPRPQFHLEHVNKRTTSRTKSLEEALDLLKAQVKAVFDELEFSGLC